MARRSNGVMAARRVESDAEPDGNPPREAVKAYWSRCEAALIGSRITVAAAGIDGRYTWLFNAPAELPGELVGKLDGEVLPASAAGALASAKQSVLSQGEPAQVELELSGNRGPRWFSVTVRPHFDRGEVIGTVASFIDITESKVQEEHLRIVLKELAHRSKNLLSVIQGIARQTAESASSTPEFLSRFNGRIFSLSRAHDILTDADWRGARIFDLVQSQIALYAGDRMASVVLEGENSFLRPNAAQYVGLALHELTTNAIKYGALSRDDGMIAVRFEQSPASATVHRLSWQETSSAEMREPSGRSFGLLMLTEVVPISVSGTAALTFRPEGVRYELDIPKAQLLP
jgi:two-component sensor histidine kinase